QRRDQRRVEGVAAFGPGERHAQHGPVAFDVQHVPSLSFAAAVRTWLSSAIVPGASAAVLTLVALVSAWHTGRHVWRHLAAERGTYAAYSDADRRRAPLGQLELPGDTFDWYASLLLHGDRAYYQVEQS